MLNRPTTKSLISRYLADPRLNTRMSLGWFLSICARKQSEDSKK